MKDDFHFFIPSPRECCQGGVRRRKKKSVKAISARCVSSFYHAAVREAKGMTLMAAVGGRGVMVEYKYFPLHNINSLTTMIRPKEMREYVKFFLLP